MITTYANTNVGISRSNNQDRYWTGVLTIGDDLAAVAVLCDGMGGLADGEKAAEVVASAVREYFLSTPLLGEVPEMLREVSAGIYKEATTSTKVDEFGRTVPDKKKMGTTCTIVFLFKGTYQVFHAGDSRAYQFHSEGQKILTKDHTGYVRQQEMYPDRPADPRLKHKLYNCMGAVQNVNIEVSSGSYQEGDMFLLGSDGFWHHYDERDIQFHDVFEKEDGGNLDQLVDICMQNGERDNVTVVVMEVNSNE